MATTSTNGDWPAGVRLHGETLVLNGKVCVPELKAASVVQEYHDFWDMLESSALLRS